MTNIHMVEYRHYGSDFVMFAYVILTGNLHDGF